ncbi:hypothetical protein pclt_cds_106 [Pandoravirus celtis]|uniref:Uncharacterized protein n=1 Tax=Pandoravirus celtis TaxID=2568002 RepID=A0A4D6EFX7_9VIRU|nr:hypothetical protein pclt_cds_106 [Pandoravirus celtis]
MYRASLTTTARHASHRAWKADLVRACAAHARHASEETAQTPTADVSPQDDPSSAACSHDDAHEVSQRQQETETITTVTKSREPPSHLLNTLLTSTIMTGGTLGAVSAMIAESDPLLVGVGGLAGVSLGASLGVMTLTLLAIPSVERTSVVTQSAPPK